MSNDDVIRREEMLDLLRILQAEAKAREAQSWLRGFKAGIQAVRDVEAAVTRMDAVAAADEVLS